MKRLYLAVVPLAVLGACQDEAADDSRAASGEVLEGTISDAMLPLDRVRSEAPLEDPDAFAEVQEEATEAAAEVAADAADESEPADESEAPESDAPPEAD